ncbi:ATP-dependent RecD-like DNA helicase [Synechococcus sp. RSCCF101]|uniref:ATP-dependent DNA helicase n=1 Tax=Synechococcus sp. RSCCF101 TaxID=2511069 RepID=UPI001786F717|nr:AAA family ATPase [Synechococcus sp. RSCCF101]
MAQALGEALARRGAQGGFGSASSLQPEERELLHQLNRCLLQSLAEGGLDLDIAAGPPAEVDGTGWPERHRQVLQAAGWLHERGPLVESNGRWSWRRWHQRQLRVRHLLERHAASRSAPERPAQPDGGDRAGGDPLLAELSIGLDPQQRRALSLIVSERLILLSGGPGTGKTSTVARMLVALHRRQPALRLQLAAPTGKAATRLSQAISEAWHAQGLEDPPPSATLHRLLVGRGSDTGSRRREPLPIDVLVIDEMSMVDLVLLERMLLALPADARLVLVGDPDQLAPVAPGAVWQELQDRRGGAVEGAVRVHLQQVHRNRGAIADLIGLIRREGPGALTHGLAALAPEANVSWTQAPAGRGPQAAIAAMRRHASRLAELAAAATSGDPSPAMRLLEELDRVVVLAPRRRGAWGVETLQRTVLGERFDASVEHWPVGTPVLCCRNLPDCDLVNGDVGVLVERDHTPWLLFPEASGRSPRWLPPARVPELEPALALTIHKAQGSQYGAVTLLLPPGTETDARLLYTGLSRARDHLTVITTPAIEEL